MTDRQPAIPLVTAEERELERVVVLSPHLDDAVLSAAHLLGTYPGCTVITVFAGRPPSYPAEPTPWDASGGFVAGDDVVALRREEDRSALALLGATAVWLDFADHQYLEPSARASSEAACEALLGPVVRAAPTSVFVPMGIANPDHVVTHEASLLLRAAMEDRGSRCAWFCYEDSGYKHIPGLLAWRVSKLFRSGLWPTPVVLRLEEDASRKRRAVECYVSQLAPLREQHGLEERLGAGVPEQFWRLSPPPAGWEALTEL